MFEVCVALCPLALKADGRLTGPSILIALIVSMASNPFPNCSFRTNGKGKQVKGNCFPSSHYGTTSEYEYKSAFILVVVDLVS